MRIFSAFESVRYLNNPILQQNLSHFEKLQLFLNSEMVPDLHGVLLLDMGDLNPMLVLNEVIGKLKMLSKVPGSGLVDVENVHDLFGILTLHGMGVISNGNYYREHIYIFGETTSRKPQSLLEDGILYLIKMVRE
jgi:hypothetical protein